MAVSRHTSIIAHIFHPHACRQRQAGRPPRPSAPLPNALFIMRPHALPVACRPQSRRSQPRFTAHMPSPLVKRCRQQTAACYQPALPSMRFFFLSFFLPLYAHAEGVIGVEGRRRLIFARHGACMSLYRHACLRLMDGAGNRYSHVSLPKRTIPASDAGGSGSGGTPAQIWRHVCCFLLRARRGCTAATVRRWRRDYR